MSDILERVTDYFIGRIGKLEAANAQLIETYNDHVDTYDRLEAELTEANRQRRIEADLASREIEELTERVHSMAPEKQFRVFMAPEHEGGLSYLCAILAVRSCNGVNEITIQHVKV